MIVRLLTAGWLGLGLVSACAGAEDRPAAWSYIHPGIIEPNCATASCHSYLVSIAGIDLSTADRGYALLTGRVCGAPPHPGDAPGNFVFPYEPERSRLLYLLRGSDTQVMPPDLPLPRVEIDLIDRWIRDGAPCD
jgi:hypothetical protein